MKFVIYRRLTLTGWQWYWRLRARNGRTIAWSGEGYRNRVDCADIVQEIRRNAAYAHVESIAP